MLGRRWLAIWVHSNSLIKNFNPFEDDAEIRLLNFIMYADSQKFLSNWKTMFWVISQQEEQHSIKTVEFTKTDSYFYSFTCKKKTYLVISSSYQWVDFFVNFLAGRKAVDSTPIYFLRAWDTNQPSIFSPCTRYKSVSSIDWSTKLSLTRQGLI